MAVISSFDQEHCIILHESLSLPLCVRYGVLVRLSHRAVYPLLEFPPLASERSFVPSTRT